MLLMNDRNDPDLVGVIETKEDFVHISKIVENMNQDLVDSGFERYQYKAEKLGQKAYVRRIQNI